jgi:hypothetical protein
VCLRAIREFSTIFGVEEQGDSGFRFDSNNTYRYIQRFGYDNNISEWTHICVSVNQTNGTAQFYENGQEIFEDTFTAGEYISSNIGQIGSDGGGNFGPVKVSDFRYYKRTLSAKEVNELYQMRDERTSNI